MTKLIKNNGDGRFLILKPFVSNTYNTWEISTRLALPETTITECTLLNTVISDQEVKCLKLLLNANGSVTLQVSTDGTTWNYSETSTAYFEANKLYYIKIIFDSQNYTISYSTDSTTYTDMGLLITTDNKCYYTANQYINFIPTDDEKYFTGSLDIDSTKIEYTIDGTETTLFNGAVASPTGVYQVGNVTTNGFTVNDYYICNALTLKTNNIKLISKVNITNLPANNTSQPIFVNRDGQGIYIESTNSLVSFRFILDTDTMIEPITGITTGSYWLGLSYNGLTYNFYTMKDESFYTLQTLPRFEESAETCIKQWVGSYINSTDNIFKEDLLIGSDASATAFNGTIDLTNTLLSNNIVNYTVNKLSYLPSNGTRLVDSDTTISSVILPTLYKVTLISEDSSGNPLDTDIKIDFNSITNGYNNYYQKVSDKEAYVPAGTSLYNNKGVQISSNIQADTTITTTLYKVEVESVYNSSTLTNSDIKINVSTVQNSYSNYYKYMNDYFIYVPSGTSVYTNKNSLISNNVTADTKEIINFYDVKVSTVTSGGTSLATDIAIDFSSITNSYNNYYIYISDTEAYLPSGSTVYTNKNSLIGSNITSDITNTITFYHIAFATMTTISTSGVSTVTINSITNNYDNYYLQDSSSNADYYFPVGTSVNYSMSKPNFKTYTDTVNNISADAAITCRLYYSNLFSLNTDITYNRYIDVLSITTLTTKLKFTLHGSRGREGHYGGYAQATYNIPYNANVRCRFVSGGYGNFGLGAGIMVNNNPLIFAGGSGISLPTINGFYGGGGHTGGYGPNGNGYSYNGTQGSSTAGNINANGAVNTRDNTTSYGGTGNTFSVSGVTMIGSATLVSNDTTHNIDPAYDPSGTYAYIKIEEVD